MTELGMTELGMTENQEPIRALPAGRRAYRRLAEPAVPWSYGVLLILGLVGVLALAASVAARGVEAELLRVGRLVLDRADLGHVGLSVDGQHLRVQGADAGETARAVALLNHAEAPTWAGAWSGGFSAVADVREGVGAETGRAQFAAGGSKGAQAKGAGKRVLLTARSAATDGQAGDGSSGPVLRAAPQPLSAPGASDGVVRNPEHPPASEGQPNSGVAAGLDTSSGSGVQGSAALDKGALQDDAAPTLQPAALGSTQQPRSTSQVQPDVAIDAPNFLFIRNGTELILTGTMTSAATRDALMATARAIVASDAGRPAGLRDIKGDVEVAPAVLNKDEMDPMPAVVRGLALLRRCIEGRASLQGGVFRFRGSAHPQELPILEQSAHAPLEGASLGLVEFSEADLDTQCGADLDKALADLEVRFVSGSAVMRGRAARGLDSVAQTLRDCDRPIMIEGYALEGEASGQAASALSTRRARVVRDALRRRGVPLARLSFRGYGAVGTVGGSARSSASGQRPIEIHVVRD